MNLFKKAPAKTQPVVQPVVQTYPVEVRFWDIHRDGLTALIKESGIDLNEMEASQRFNCKLVPGAEGTMKVFAAVKGRGKTYHEVGHLRADTVELIRPDIAKVNARLVEQVSNCRMVLCF